MAEVFKITGLYGTLDLLRRLPPEVVSKRGGPVKRALLKGARVIQLEAALNIARSTDAIGIDGDEQSTGLLQKSVVSTRGKAPFDGNGERYLVRVKRVKYPREGKPVTTLKTAHLKEYGSSTQPAEPWLRPAFDKKKEQAVETITTALLKDLDKIVRKLGKQGGLS